MTHSVSDIGVPKLIEHTAYLHAQAFRQTVNFLDLFAWVLAGQSVTCF